MPESGDIEADIIEPLWVVGWYAKEAFVALFILSLVIPFTQIPDWIAGFTLIGAFFIPPAGVIYVMLNWKDVREAGLNQATVAATSIVDLEGENINRYNLLDDSGSGIILPPSEYYVSTLLVEDSLLLAHDDTTVELPWLNWEVGDSSTEYYYDQITNINYQSSDIDNEPGEFWINLSGGHSASYDSTREPDDALNDIQQRLREFKKIAA